jgi:hypothetical protein
VKEQRVHGDVDEADEATVIAPGVRTIRHL